jgi:hypothetical protein
MSQKTAKTDGDGARTGRVCPRPQWAHQLAILMRAAHQVGAAVFLAAFLLEGTPRPPVPFVWLAVSSGGLLTLLEWWRHRQLFRELAGGITVLKVLLLGAAYHGFFFPAVSVLLTFVAASVGSHAPKRVRHRLLF